MATGLIGSGELIGRYGGTRRHLDRYVQAGVFRPRGVGGSGNPWWWDAAEQRAYAAVMTFTRSTVADGVAIDRAALRRRRALRAIAEAARWEPDGSRWLIVLGDGTCIRGGDDLAVSMPLHRTLIPCP